MWQSCPVCKGEGRVRSDLYINMPEVQCSVCKGRKIISTLTGHPPAVTKVQEEKPLTGVADPLKNINIL
jgi:hypothetical protein